MSESDTHPDDLPPDDRFSAEIRRDIEIIKGLTYRFNLLGHAAKPLITEDSPRERTIVPVQSLEGTVTGLVHDVIDGSIFVVFEGGSLTLTSDAVTWAEEVEV